MSKGGLEPHTIPLQGRHLLEASAGTGKTYNITRLYIRLLIEKQLDVQSILVMTFTKAATEELRGRIDKELRNAEAHWGTLGNSDPFYAALEAQYAGEQVVPLLRNALLHLDEASIFTIHAFCARVLKQHAFTSDIALDVEMEADTTELVLDGLRDWFRRIVQDEAYQQLIDVGWHTPEAFWDKFSWAIKSDHQLLALSEQRVIEQWLQTKSRVKAALLDHEALILECLVNHHAQQAARTNEWAELLAWLDSAELSEPSKTVMGFVNGNRYRGQDELKAIFQPFKELKDQAKKEVGRAASSAAYQLVVQGISFVRSAFAKAKEQQGVMDFDDLIARLAERVQSPAGGALVAQLQGQYPVALVDEFQDTDPQQYAILDALYPKVKSPKVKSPEVTSSEVKSPEVTSPGAKDPTANAQQALFMIGDPKQAIYSFRGGDIFTYLQARQATDYTWHMDTNWRSVAAMVSGYNRLFWGAPLAEDGRAVFGYGIDYQQVNATPHASANKTPLSDVESDRGAMNYVWFVPDAAEKESVTADFKQVIARWCSAEIDRLLSHQAKLGDAKLQERDIAILVRTTAEAHLLQDALQAAGYASVYLSARDNVFHSAEADELLWVLKGILSCEDSRALVSACSTHLMGGDARQLAAMASDAEVLVDTRYRFMALREQWRVSGFMPMMMGLIHTHLKPSVAQHERVLTNYLHLAELLQQASGNLRHPQQLIEWLVARMRLTTAGQDAELRLESDANLIRIITQHGSKGLEYPIVFVPYANYPKDPIKFKRQELEYYQYHDPVSNQPLQMIGRDSEAQRLCREEGFAEAIRLLYVAVTRAEQRCYVCAAPFKDSQDSPLARTLNFASGDQWPEVLKKLVDGGCDGSQLLCIHEAEVVQVRRPALPLAADTLQAATFSGKIERHWHLSSFTSLVRNVSHRRQDRTEHDDDSSSRPLAEAESAALRFSLAKGAHAGNLLHDTLEHCDFSQPNWPLLLKDPVLRFGGLTAEQQIELADWLQQCLDTELPAIAPAGSGPTLSGLAFKATLRESEFYFPMHGSQRQALVQILKDHRQTDGAIDLPRYQSLSGMMHGFIDLIFEFEGRYYLADYKSTHLGSCLSEYDYAAIKRNNEAHFYDLQYLIYCLALHRYLSTRIEAYDPGRHFGGVYYLYLRGMQPGSDTGIFHTAISPALLHSLDRLFDGAVSDNPVPSNNLPDNHLPDNKEPWA